jgi:hypothetical protein
LRPGCSSTPAIWIGLLAIALSPAAPASSTLTLRDAVTGYGLDGTVTLASVDADAVVLATTVDDALSDPGRRRTLPVADRADLSIEGPHALVARVDGYQPLRTILRPATAENEGWTLLLDPIEPPEPKVASAPGYLRIEGWVHDHESLEAVGDVRVAAAGGSAFAITGPDGRFAFDIPAPRIEDGVPKPLTVIASAPGYPDWRRSGLLADDGRLRLQVALGTRSPSADGHRQQMAQPVWPEARPQGRRDASPLPGLRADQPPGSITVGFGDAGCSVPCCTGNCSHSCVMSLEHYVRRGLGDEWIASWEHDALAAGAVAYRSYGAWHVRNPPAHGAYDICSSACCQANDPDTHGATDQAAAATAGLMLIREKAIFRSEYSAQNNCLSGSASCTNSDLSCGDGFAGSPATGWPCLADPVGTGRDCFGHGRGMSQWGNHFWTQASPPRNWHWQLDHYYNDHGDGSGLRTAVISRVLSITGASTPAGALAPGQSFTIELDADNLAAAVHENVLIGASLRRGSDPFIDDPANDRLVQLPSGPSSTSRAFDLPPDSPTGEYALWLALWLDVDRDGAISSEDLSQDLVVVESAIRVGGVVFRDRFED